MRWDPSGVIFSWKGLELNFYSFFFGTAFLAALFLVKWIVFAYFSRHPFYREGDIKERRELAFKLQCPPDEVVEKLNRFSREEGDLLFAKEVISLKERASLIAEMGWLVFFIGALIGSRLGHIFFYCSLREVVADPFMIFRIYEGGLSSHGGVIGVLMALFIWIRWYREYFTPLRVLDLLSPPALLIAALIRLGNFFNQELIGTVTTVPWAVTFVHPIGGVGGLPRHPVQLYESFFYFMGFILLLWTWIKNKTTLPEGRLIGSLFFSVFLFRFVIEFLKEPHGYYTSESPLLMGQILSVPLIVIGYILLRKSYVGS
ncbi:MAG: prolipoprotein diacylglyceryl transferase [Simkaniaceae bacterium]|nr:prolipoprotein diacylglyceryl transferase [Simkaniaceae bacterium]